MIKYSTTFNKAYKTEYNRRTKEVKNYLINGKSENHRYIFIHNKILEQYYNLEVKLFKNNSLFETLEKEFQVLRNNYEIDYELITLSRDLEPKFKLNKSTDTFLEFVKNLAEKEAIKHVRYNYRNNSTIFEMMYDIKRFDNFKNMPEFEIIKYSTKLENTKIHIELSEILNTSLNLDQQKNKASTENLEKKNGLNLRSKYRNKFKKEETYKLFTADIIDNTETTQEDFTNVFLQDFNSHSSEIQFKCKTTEASLLLSKMLPLFHNLTVVKLCGSNMFKSNLGNHISSGSLNQSKSTISNKDRDFVDDFYKNLLHIISPEKKQ